VQITAVKNYFKKLPLPVS